jgi:nitrogen regulatory protein PII
MKMVFVVYSRAADYDVMDAIRRSGIKGYTKVEKACGEGVETEPKLQTHTWPGENCVLFLALKDEEMPPVLEVIRTIKQVHPRSGIKAFVLPMEQIV